MDKWYLIFDTKDAKNESTDKEEEKVDKQTEKLAETVGAVPGGISKRSWCVIVS